MQLGRVEVDAGRVARAQRVAQRGQAGFDRRRGGLRGRASRGGRRLERRPSALHLAEELLRVGDQLVGDRFGVDLERAVGDRRAMRATLSASNSALAPPESRVDAVLDSATVALASAARGGAAPARALRRPCAASEARPACRRPSGGSGLSAGCPIFMGLSRGAGGAGTDMDGLSARPAATLEIFARTHVPGRPFTAPAPRGARRSGRPVTPGRFRCGSAPAGPRCRSSAPGLRPRGRSPRRRRPP